jgi:hypothetical protein
LVELPASVCVPVVEKVAVSPATRPVRVPAAVRGAAVVGLGGVGRRDGEGGRRDLVGAVDRAGVVADAGDGGRDGADVGGVVRVGERVVGALDQDLARRGVGHREGAASATGRRR